jgi:hypothetical protein
VSSEAGIVDARQPQAAVDEQGSVYVAFGSGDTLYCSTSTDGGRRFAPPVRVAETRALALGMRRGPRVAVAGKSVVIAAVAGELGGGKDGDVVSWRSADHGATWHGPARINDVAGSAREGLHALACGRNGKLYCVWLDLRNMRTEIFGASSSDGGEAWSENRLIYHSPSGSVCECCHPSAAFGPEGGLHVMWRNSLDGNRDLYAVTSRDGGKTFGKAQKLGSGTWSLDHCPMDGGCLAAKEEGRMASVWRRDRQVFATGLHTGRQEELLGEGEQPWAASTPDGIYAIWVTRRRGDLWLLAPNERAPRKLADSASDPVLAAPPSGRGPVVALWESEASGHTEIVAQVVTAHDVER